MPKGFFYLVAIMDWHSRKVLSWRLSNTMDAIFCVEALEEALALYGRPEIFNSDQGAQFTNSPACWRLPASGSAWTAKVAAWIMFSWNACGAA